MNQLNEAGSERSKGMNGANGAQHYARSEVIVPNEPRQRYSDGWRAGKPAEDPEKLKKWGLISVKPSEFLIHMRGARVLTKSSGQGASCFKWPWDSVAIVPTTVQRLRFTADQVTNEKVGVSVTGLAVYRIADPMIAFRMLNFSFPERASEKLEQMLVEMFVGAARRLVANLTVEQCLTKRKEGIAAELMKEIAPVVSGSGRPDDHTIKGWGVVIDTIEIQDVRVLSSQVFANMQARYRQEAERQAREAELAKQRSVKHQEADAERQVALAKLAAETEVKQRKQTADEQARMDQVAAEARMTEAQRQAAVVKLEAEAEVRRRKQAAEEQARMEQLAAEARMAEAKLAHERAMAVAKMQAEVEKVQLEGQAAQAKHAAEMEKAHQELEKVEAHLRMLEARRQAAEVEVALAELATRRAVVEQDPELTRMRELRQIENTLSQEAIQMAVAQRLPELAQAFQQKMGEVHVTAVDGANPFGYVAAAVEGVLGLARSAGLPLPKKGEQPEKQ